MTRISINGKGQAFDGDLTTTGAVCIASNTHYRGNNQRALRLGDATTECPACKKPGVIVEGQPFFKIEGKPAVVDGAMVKCGCPEGSNRVVAMGGPGLAASPSAAQQVSQAATSGQAGSISPIRTSLAGNKPQPVICKDPDMMEQVARYIAEEMNRNIKHPSVLKMQKLTSFDAVEEHAKFKKLPWYASLLPPDFQAMMVGNTAAAMALWAERVGQNRPWDHKKVIRQQFGGTWHKQGEVDYYYDIWSNIHYGYVGRAGGLSESALLDGAGLEQIASDTIRKIDDWDEQDGPRRYADIDGMRAWDDIGDRVSISIGIKLHKQQPDGGITAKVLMDEVLAVSLSSWGGSVRDHLC
ncbi:MULTISPECIES: polymorphic toxin type 44 domain-containing protein [unclassified Pseudomonas]|uniref:polymorphic toxin type 44 domain-containing protein n=1 Tax=unclassified Pseudomonas TaxID=196821 RepID=UPI000A1EF347|nr:MULTISPECIES: polymorphic toxin type 44 domain-containing protein [unclassified Pseudomonas]